MIKNRTAQLVFLSAFCTIGLLGTIASFGTFNYEWRGDFFVHFTNLSNYLCIAVGVIELVHTIKKKEDSYINSCRNLKFIGMLMILLTFLVFNGMLAPTREAYLNFRINSVLFHIVIPIMYVADWFLFYERKQISWKLPLISISAPLIYVIFIYIRAWILGFDSSVPYIYPYFFLDLDKQGIDGVLIWIGILFVGFVALGYAMYGIDRISRKKEVKVKGEN